ncbi:M10 family metallopeptidase C-terminal domain-containing protein [Methylobacterium sp. Leaf91]|uniref:M10 family metallopeptidase C-terminal domain-containing protein n=1 Tax=Methylobacterium sp. Leaf91 TaxID=1736247 RepID=UPI0006F9E929|nr:M10 family metallopeptidase C-terminal domain-containing protein [Methylobacterium sp. Leaf91]KQO59055.1 hypothetical protein ASF24_12745 [Methylobacterium sp. Leaf86]KQO89192.1 hypothetical protein ASF32_23705 [Methylobacterium sp. Leaf91]
MDTAGLQSGMFAHVSVVGIAGADGKPVPTALSQTQPAIHSTPDATHTTGVQVPPATGIFQVDTGSWATVLPQALVEAAVGTIDWTKYPQYQKGSLEYSSDGTVESGRWVPLILAFPDATLPDGSVPTTTVTALVQTDGGSAHMLGIGFNTTYATHVVGTTLTSANNAVLNLADMKSGEMAHSYMIDSEGMHLGWTIPDQGSDWTVQQLDAAASTPSRGSPQDWLNPTGSVTIDGTVHDDVSFLFDTGTPKAFVHYPGLASDGRFLPDGRTVSVSVPGAHGDPMTYGFTTGDNGAETPPTVHESLATHGPSSFMNTGANFFRDHRYVYDADRGLIGFEAYDAATASPTMAQQVSFLNGLFPDGTIDGDSFAGLHGATAHKFGAQRAGTGAAVTYAFDPASGFSETEQATVLRAFATWSGVANVQFTEVGTSSSANILIQRGHDGKADTTSPLLTSTLGSGSVIGQIQKQVVISMDTSVPGFDLSGSLTQSAGYGFSAIVHEIGHSLGLGHAGNYNAGHGSADYGSNQFSTYDDRMWTVMSYLSWVTGDAAFKSDYPVKGTNWGYADGEQRVAPQSLMQLDILAIQQLYGVALSKNTPFTGGQTYGFNSTITGTLADIYDFSVNKQPIVTIYNQGLNNTLDLSGFTEDAVIDLRPGAFSSAGGYTNNIAIAQGTVIEKAFGGSGKNTIMGNDAANVLHGGISSDTINGGTGADLMRGHQGDDIYIVDNTRDRAIERAGEGNDTVFAYADYKLRDSDSIEVLVAVDLTPNVGLRLTGNELNQTLRGGVGNDILNGGGGHDKLYGNAGNDTYLVHSQNDQVFESGTGWDTVVAFSNYALADGQTIEVLKLGIATGTAGLGLTGNDVSNILRGNGGSNSLDGGLGADALRGLEGSDTFVFSTALSRENVDRITDFTVGEDVIHLDHAIFAALNPGGLSAGAFKNLDAPHAKLDASDRILYDHDTGVLSYDADGSGTGHAVRFAVLTNKADLSYHDIFVV